MATAADTFDFPTTGVSAPNAVLLAIDDASLPLRKNLHLIIEKPTVLPEPVLLPSSDNPNAPDSLAAHFYGTVLFDQDKFRMWYYACHTGRNPDWPEKLMKQAERWKDNIIPGPLCYAESNDGIHWTKPNLGQRFFKGSRDNNALDLPSALTGDACVIRDDDDPDPARRYKLAYWSQYDPFDFPTMRLATSPDGLHWTAFPEPPIKSFLEHASFYKFNGAYFANSQTLQAPPGKGGGARVGTAWMSPDFDHWLQESTLSFALPWSDNPARDEVHLGVGARAYPNVLVGLYCIWHNQPDFAKISGDFGLLVSNDGLAFREPVKGHVWLSTAESAATPAPGKTLPTILCQANGILNVADETWIYHGRWRNSDYGKPGVPVEDYGGDIALAKLPRDRWGALTLTEGNAEGTVWSAPVTLPKNGAEILLNGEHLKASRIEIADVKFTLDPAYSAKNAGAPALESGLESEALFSGKSLKELGGQTIRLKVTLKKAEDGNPRLFAIYLRPTQERATEATAVDTSEFVVPVGDHAVVARVLSPPHDKLAPEPALLLTFAMDRATSTAVHPYCEPAEYFLANGHRVLSIDLPNHGERVNQYGSGIDGFRNAFIAGHDPFAMLVDDAKAAISACIDRGLARAGHIAVCGTSRGGYMALRVLAADSRVAAGAGFAPVTDWTLLREFAADTQSPGVQALRLSNFLDGLAKKPIYLAIGKTDERVGTQSCVDLHAALIAAGSDGESARLQTTEDKGHSLSDPYYDEGRKFLLNHVQ